MKIWPFPCRDPREEDERPQRVIEKTMDHVDGIIREQKDRNAKQWTLIMKWYDRAKVAKAYHVPLLIDADTWTELVALGGFPWNPYSRDAIFGGVQVLVPLDGGGKLQ